MTDATDARTPALRPAQHVPAADPRRVPADRGAQVVPYLAALGVGACYTSPYFTAAPGSTHGYDV